MNIYNMLKNYVLVKGAGDLYLFAYIPLPYANLLHGQTRLELSYSGHHQ